MYTRWQIPSRPERPVYIYVIYKVLHFIKRIQICLHMELLLIFTHPLRYGETSLPEYTTRNGTVVDYTYTLKFFHC